MQEDGDGIHQQRRSDPARHGVIGEDVRAEDGTVRVGEQDEPVESGVVGEDPMELGEELRPREDGMGGETGGDLQDFETEDADLVVGRGGGVEGAVLFVEEGDVRVETHADAVEVEDGEAGSRSVRAQPVGELRGWGGGGGG